MSNEELKAIFSKLIGEPVKSLDRLRHGRNSSVFKIVCENSVFLGKQYPPKSPDTRDRLAAEFGAFTFLWNHGVTCIPEPLEADLNRQIGLYEFVPGERPSSISISKDDIDSAAEFLGVLNQLTKDSNATYLMPAAEACLSIQSIVENIHSRLVPLKQINAVGPDFENLREYLSNSFTPALKKITQWSRSVCENYGFAYDSEISKDEQTLSPSDFGFHNSIRRSDGQITFLDFEYFGWDDPAKTISDFLLHPAMNLASPYKNRFMTRAIQRLGEGYPLSERVSVTYPLFGLKWSLILLNEFLPEHLARRTFANGEPIEQNNVLPVQLKKAKTMTKQIINQYRQFPFHD